MNSAPSVLKRSVRLGFRSSTLRLSAAGCLLSSVLCIPISAQNQTINGNLTVTGSIEAAGAIDSGANTLTFGTQGSGFGGALLHQDSNTDTFTFLSNRNPASWLWQHTVGIAAMRLDASHQLILYQANGTTAGVTLAPASNSIKLGTHANGTLTADTNGVITAGGGFAVAGGITNTNGTLTGGSTGLTLNAGGTNQNLTLNSSGGDLIFSTSSTERMRIKTAGNVGIGTAAPERILHVARSAPDNTPGGTAGSYEIAQFKVHGSNGAKRGLEMGAPTGGIVSPVYLKVHGTSSRFSILNEANSEQFTILGSGNVGIGTTSPAYKVHAEGDIGVGGNKNFIARYNGSESYRATLGWSHLQLGNNGANWITAGRTAAGGSLSFIVNNTNDYAYNGFNGIHAMEITSGGYVGIGTTSPGTKLEVRNDHASDPVLRLSNAQATRSAVALEFRGDYNGTGNPYQLGRLLGQADGTSWVDARITLQTVNGAGAFVDTLTAKNGNVGIGTTSPDSSSKLHIAGVGGITVTGNYSFVPAVAGLALDYHSPASTARISVADGAGGWIKNLALQPYGGNVGIGTTAPTHKLAVKGTIRAEEVIVDTGWADYVFEEDYRLAPLAEVEEHIKTKKHLPGIPSAAEVAEHGVSMGEMQARMMAKIEELTLHMIAQEKELAALKAQNANFQDQLAHLKAIQP